MDSDKFSNAADSLVQLVRIGMCGIVILFLLLNFDVTHNNDNK